MKLAAFLVATMMLVAANAQTPPGVLHSTTLANSDTTQDPPTVTAIAVEAQDNTYATGWIRADGFTSTPGVIQRNFAGGTCPSEDSQINRFVDGCEDAFIAKFNSQGKLLFLTYLGGTGADIRAFVAVDLTSCRRLRRSRPGDCIGHVRLEEGGRASPWA